MEIALISSKDSLVDIIGQLKKYLEKEIMNIEVVAEYAESALEIPKVAKNFRGCKLILIFAMLEKGNYKLATIAKYLVDFEMKSDSKVILALEEYLEKEGEPDLDELKESLYKKYRKLIMETLYSKEQLKEAGKKF